MDIALLSMSLSQSRVQQQASLSVMKMAMNQAQAGAEGLAQLLASADVAKIQHAAQPHLGGNLDIRV